MLNKIKKNCARTVEMKKMKEMETQVENDLANVTDKKTNLMQIGEIRSLKEIHDLKRQNTQSYEVEEIMGYIPHWIIRCGISIIFFTIILLLVGSWFFYYPDVIVAPIVVTTENPPVNLVSKTSGKIQYLFVNDNQHVEKNTVAIVIENASDYYLVFELKKKLEKFRMFFNGDENDSFMQMRFAQDYVLGELQSDYEAFLNCFFDYQSFLEMNSRNNKIGSLKEQLGKQKSNLKSLENQLKLLEEDFDLSKQQSERSRVLLKEGYISQNDFDNANSFFIQKKYSVEGARLALSNSVIQSLQLEQSIRDLQMEYNKQKNDFLLGLKQYCNNLLGQISLWEQKYILKCPISGVISLSKYWSVNQNVEAGDVMMTVISEGSKKIVGKVTLPIQGSGKVAPGQVVNVKFDNFPYLEYGIVHGEVKSKSLVPNENAYTVEASFANGLLTNTGKKLKFSEGINGHAEIITGKNRLLLRFLQPIQMILKN